MLRCRCACLFLHSQIPSSSLRYADQVDKLLISREDLPIGYRRDAFLLDAWVVGLWEWPEFRHPVPCSFLTRHRS